MTLRCLHRQSCSRGCAASVPSRISVQWPAGCSILVRCRPTNSSQSYKDVLTEIWRLIPVGHPHTLRGSLSTSLDNAVQLLSRLLASGAHASVNLMSADQMAELVLALGATGLRRLPGTKPASMEVEVETQGSEAEPGTTISDRARHSALRRMLLVVQSATALRYAFRPPCLLRPIRSKLMP